MQLSTRVAIYARTSTDEQDTTQQVNLLSEYAENRGWEVEGVYVDEGISAKKTDRPKFLKVVDKARKRDIDAVLVFRFDRWSRSLKQLINTLDEFKAIGVDFISYTENIDTTTPMGTAMYQMIGVFAEFERRMISEATKQRLDALKRLGKKLGRPVETDHEMIRQVAEENPDMSIRKIAEVTGCSKSTVSRVLRVSHKGGSDN